MPVVVGLEQDGTQVRVPCGREFHSGPVSAPTAPVCSCGNFAVRVCTTCGQPLCGDHGVRSTEPEHKWQCGRCHRAAATEKKATLDRGREAVKERYRQLPPVPDELLVRWLRGEVPESSFVDGKTHRASHLSGAAVAEIVARELGEFTSYILLFDSFRKYWSFPNVKDIPSTRNPDTGTVMLRRDGSIVERLHVADLGAREVPTRKPKEPFNSFHVNNWQELSGINSEAFIAVRRMADINRGRARASAEAARTPTAKSRQQRAVDRSANLQLAGCLLFVLFFIALTVTLIFAAIHYWR